MTPNALFKEFITDITPSVTTNNRSSSAHNSIRNALNADDKYKGQIIRTFLGGSYKRKTAIRPVTCDGDTERPDVDIYVVVEGSAWTKTPNEIIEDLFSALNRNRDDLGITRLKRNRCSIAISTSKADMDISPLLDRNADDYFRIGNRNTDEWYKTDPEEHTTWSAEVNKNAANRFNPMIKMVKWSRREFPTKSKHPKSIALEALIAEHVSTSETHYGQLIHDTFESIINSYSTYRLLEICPVVKDPVIPHGNLLSGVSGTAFAAFYDKIEKFRDEARKGLDAEDQDVATKHWRKILGSRFPSPKNSTSNVKKAAAISPLTFPEAASTPPNKPADFA